MLEKLRQDQTWCRGGPVGLPVGVPFVCEAGLSMAAAEATKTKERQTVRKRTTAERSILPGAEDQLLAPQSDDARSGRTRRLHLERDLRVGFAAHQTEQIAERHATGSNPRPAGV